jgi:hypothetical protein
MKEVSEEDKCGCQCESVGDERLWCLTLSTRLGHIYTHSLSTNTYYCVQYYV